jgi:hypothetical protein
LYRHPLVRNDIQDFFFFFFFFFLHSCQPYVLLIFVFFICCSLVQLCIHSKVWSDKKKHCNFPVLKHFIVVETM